MNREGFVVTWRSAEKICGLSNPGATKSGYLNYGEPFSTMTEALAAVTRDQQSHDGRSYDFGPLGHATKRRQPRVGESYDQHRQIERT